MGGGPLKKKTLTKSVLNERADHVLGLCIHEAELGALDGGKRIEPAGVAWLRQTFRKPFRTKMTDDPGAYPRDRSFLTKCSYLLGRIATTKSNDTTVDSQDLLAALEHIQGATCGKMTKTKFGLLGVWCDIG